MEKIRIDFYTTDSEEIHQSVFWPSAPRAGDHVHLSKKRYEVIDVDWGHAVTGNGHPLFDQVAVAIELQAI